MHVWIIYYINRYPAPILLAHRTSWCCSKAGKLGLRRNFFSKNHHKRGKAIFGKKLHWWFLIFNTFPSARWEQKLNNDGEYEKFVAVAARLTRWIKNFRQFYENRVAYASTPLYVRAGISWGEKPYWFTNKGLGMKNFVLEYPISQNFPKMSPKAWNQISLVLLTSFKLSEALKVPFIPRPSAYHIKR